MPVGTKAASIELGGGVIVTTGAKQDNEVRFMR